MQISLKALCQSDSLHCLQPRLYVDNVTYTVDHVMSTLDILLLSFTDHTSLMESVFLSMATQVRLPIIL